MSNQLSTKPRQDHLGLITRYRRSGAASASRSCTPFVSTTDLFQRDAPWILPRPAPAGQAPLTGLADALVALPRSLREALGTRGLRVRNPTEADRLALLAAQQLIQCVPDLWRVVAHTVGRISPLGDVDEAFDVSHSEPLLGDIILLSVPPAAPSARLRLSEEVVHEAMHLNLSALEKAVPLVRSSELLYSPWRSTLREAGGVLHGLYVFGCLARFMERLLASKELSAAERAHSRRRVEDIDADLSKVDHGRLVANLTTKGAALTNDLLAASQARRQAADNA